MSNLKSNNFIQTTLGELVSKEKKSIISGPFGSNIGKIFFKEKGIPVIRGNNLSTGGEKFKDDGFVFITREKADALNCYAIKNDLIFTAVGTIGQVGIIDEKLKYDEYVISNKQLRVRFDNDKITPLFAYYWFSSYWIQKLIVQRNVGSTVPLINLSVLKGLPITLPKSIDVQNGIVKVLENISAKIELNNRINAELEAMAKTLYDYWFVQFEFPCLPENYKFSGAGKPTNFESCFTYRQVGGLPVPDGKKWFVYVLLCEDGSFYKGMTNDLYRRYYEHHTGQGAEHTKVHQPQKVIHWEIFSSQSEAASREKELKTGFGRTWLQREYEYLINHKPGLPAHQNARPSKLMPAGKMVWNEELKREIPNDWDSGELKDIANITMGQSPPGESYNEEGNGMIFYQGCTDFGNRFPTVRKFTTEPTRFAKVEDILLSVRAPVGTLNIAKEDCCIGRGLASLNSKDNCIGYLFGVMVNLKQIFDRRNVNGTTFGSITKDDLFSLKVVKPTINILEKYHIAINSSFEKQNQLELENIKLTELRDWLLPMLMNGQVKVSEL